MDQTSAKEVGMTVQEGSSTGNCARDLKFKHSNK